MSAPSMLLNKGAVAGLARHRWKFIALCVVVLLLVWLAPGMVRSAIMVRDARACDGKASQAEKIDCWMQMVFSRMRSHGMVPAYRVFSYIYDAYPEFGASGCHQHAHTIGDIAYYDVYVAEGKTLQDMDFPQETTSCGYGFYHGFIEHLIQDRTNVEFVVETCEYLRSRLSGTMRDIGTICYHASGHGFMQAQADTLSEREWGDAVKLVVGPLRACEQLPTNAREIEDCREGVFNVVSDWMTTKDFGLEYDYDDPFWLCGALETSWHYACYYELGMKLTPIIHDSPLRAARYVQSITDTEIREMTFGVMVAGMMQREAPLDGYEKVLGECLRIEDAALYKVCIRSSANGMMEHGAPGKEYEKVLVLCATPGLAEHSGDEACYGALALRLSRFYPPEKKMAVCELFPEVYRDMCRQSP